MFLIFNCHESVVVINGSIFLNKHMQSFSLRVDSSLFAIPFFPSNLTSITSSKLSFSSNSHLLTLFFNFFPRDFSRILLLRIHTPRTKSPSNSLLLDYIKVHHYMFLSFLFAFPNSHHCAYFQISTQQHPHPRN